MNTATEKPQLAVRKQRKQKPRHAELQPTGWNTNSVTPEQKQKYIQEGCITSVPDAVRTLFRDCTAAHRNSVDRAVKYFLAKQLELGKSFRSEDIIQYHYNVLSTHTHDLPRFERLAYNVSFIDVFDVDFVNLDQMYAALDKLQKSRVEYYSQPMKKNMTIRGSIEKMACFWMNNLRYCDNFVEAYVKMLDWLVTFQNGKMTLRSEHSTLNPIGVFLFYSFVQEHGVALRQFNTVQRAFKNRSKPLSDVARDFDWEKYLRKLPSMSVFRQEVYTIPEVRDYIYEMKVHNHLVDGLLAAMGFKQVAHDSEKMDRKAIISFAYKWYVQPKLAEPTDFRCNNCNNPLSHDTTQCKSRKDDVEEVVNTLKGHAKDAMNWLGKGAKEILPESIYSIVTSSLDQLSMVKDFAMMAMDKVRDMMSSFSKFLGLTVKAQDSLDLGLSLVKYYVIYINTTSTSLKAVILYAVFSQLGLVDRLVKFFCDFDYKNYFPAAEPTRVEAKFIQDGPEPTSFSGAIYDWLVQMYEWLISLDPKMVIAPLSCIAFLLFARTLPAAFVPQMGGAFVQYMRNMHFIGAGLTGMTKIFDCIVRAVKFVVDWVGQKLFNRLPEEEQEREKLKKFLDEFAMWQAEVEVCSMDEYREAMVRSKKLKLQVDRLYKQGLLYARLVLEPNIPTAVQVTFRNVWPKIQKLENMATRARCMDDFRVCPFHLQLFGDPGVGKSHLIKNLTAQIGRTHFPDCENLIYGANPSLDFADGYEGQNIWLIDDTFPANDFKMYVPWLQMVSNVPLRVPMAHLDDKGRMFTSKLIVSTTNTPYPRPDGMYKHEAIWRRRHILAKVRIDPDVLHDQTKQFDKTKFEAKYPGQSSSNYPHLFFDLYVPTKYNTEMQEITNPPLNLRKPLKNLSYSEFIARFDVAYAAHTENEAHFAAGNSSRNRARLTRFLEEFDDFVKKNNIGSSHWYEQNYRDDAFTRPTPCDEQDETEPQDQGDPNVDTEEEQEAFGQGAQSVPYEDTTYFRYVVQCARDQEWDEPRFWFFMASIQSLVDGYGNAVMEDARIAEAMGSLNDATVEISGSVHPFSLELILLCVNRLMRTKTLYAYRCFRGALVIGAVLYDTFKVTNEMDEYVAYIRRTFPTATFDQKGNWNDLYDEEEEDYLEELIELLQELREKLARVVVDPELKELLEALSENSSPADFITFATKCREKNLSPEVLLDIEQFGNLSGHYIGLKVEIGRRESCRRHNRPTGSFRNAAHAEQHRREQAGPSSQSPPPPPPPPRDFGFTFEDEANASGNYRFGEQLEEKDGKTYSRIYRDMVYHVMIANGKDGFGYNRWLERWIDPPIVGKMYYSVPVTEVEGDEKPQISLLFIQKLRLIRNSWHFEYDTKPELLFPYHGRMIKVKGSQFLGSRRWFRDSLKVFMSLDRVQRNAVYNRLKNQAASCTTTFWFQTIKKKAADWFERTWMFLSAMGHTVWDNLYVFYPHIAGVCLAGALVCLSTIYAKLFIPDKPEPTSVPSGRGFGRPSFAAGRYATGTAAEMTIPRRVREAIGVVSINGNMSQGLKLCNRMMLICWHTVSKWSSDEISFTYWNGKFTITCMLNRKENFHHIPGTDSCIVHAREFPLWPDIRKYFMEKADLETELNEYCTMLVSKYEEMEYYATRIRSIRKLQKVRFNNGQAMHYGVMAEVDAQFPKGTSGAPVLASGRAIIQNRCILGTQSCAYETSSIVSCPTRELLEQETNKLAGLYIRATEPLWYVEEQEAVGTDLLEPHLTYHGSVPKDFQTHTSSMTEFERTRLFEYFPLKRVPAILSPKNRYACVHPIRYSMNKHGRGDKVQLPKQYLSVAVDYRSELYRAQLGIPRILSFEEAIIGNADMDHINLNTSPGLPYSIKNMAKGKHGLIKISKMGELEYVDPDVIETVNGFIALMKQGISPPSNMQEVMKDELRPIGKALGLSVDQVEELFFAGVSPSEWPQDRTIKTRSITVLNLCFTIIYRMYFGDMMCRLQKFANGLNEYCVGINVESVAAFRTYSKIIELGGKGIDSDVANWDGGFTPQLAFAVVDIVNAVYRSPIEDQNLRYTLLDTVMFGFVQYENFVYQKHSGMPSGFPGTADFNTLGHILLTDVFWQEIFVEANLPELAILAAKREYSLWLVYGDDLLCVPHKALHDFVTPTVLTSKYEKYGWHATSSVKDGGVHFAPVEDLVFLKRRFLVSDDDPAYVRWALDKDTIVSLLQYVRKTKSPGNQFRQNLVMALDYAADWGETYFDELKDKMNLALKNEGLKPVVVLYSEMKRFKRMRYFEDSVKSDVTAKALLLQRLLSE